MFTLLLRRLQMGFVGAIHYLLRLTSKLEEVLVELYHTFEATEFILAVHKTINLSR
ncbi:MAG TPA: hypothetical protein V6D50_13330 [Chroococcales cyanobacterium]